MSRKRSSQTHRLRILVSVLFLSLTLSWLPLRHVETAPGDLDQGFGIAAGKTFADFVGNDDEAFAVATQGDGKIIIAGYASFPNRVFALIRYKPDGNLDPSFGTAGKVTTDFSSGGAEIHSLAIQTDGKIVAAGNSGTSFAIARYDASGTLDPGFGSGGKITTAMSDFDVMTAYAVVIQSNGQIVAAGGNQNNFTFAMARYNSDGSLDSGFGSGGKLTRPLVQSGAARGLAIQSDGKIVVAGSVQNLNTGDTDFAVLRFNSNGTPDPGFGSAGKLSTRFSIGNDEARSVAVLPDGKIVVAGRAFAIGASFDFALARYSSNGALDPGFGSDGKVMTNFFAADPSVSFDDAYAIAVQSDGKIIVGGSIHFDNTGSHFALARYNPDGSLDPTFGKGGKTFNDHAGSSDDAFAIALQQDGKVLVAGNSLVTLRSRDFALARFNTNGSPDTSFGPKGRVVTDFNHSNDQAQGIVVQRDGKIIVTGSSDRGFALARYNIDGGLDGSFGSGGKVSTDFGNGGNSLTGNNAGICALQSDEKIVLVGFARFGDEDFAVARFNPDGSFDMSFGDAGRVTTNFRSGTRDVPEAVVVQSDGKIVVGGRSGFDFALARYNSDGSLDPGFGTSGKVVTDFSDSSDFLTGLALQPDGGIVAGGISISGNSFRFALARYNSNGSLDNSFGSNGKVTTKIPDGVQASDLAIQSDGRIVVVGGAGSGYAFALVRYNTDGSLDTGFGTDGKVTTTFAGAGFTASASAILIQRNGKIIAVGTAALSVASRVFALARYNKDGSLDPDFGSSGKIVTPISSSDDRAVAIAAQPDGKIVVAGTSDNAITDFDFAIARYDDVGALDSSFDICIQDDSNGNLMQINSASGDYRFTSCGTAFTLAGTGALSRKGQKLTLEDRSAGRNVSVTIKKLKKASGSVEVSSTGASFSISDKKLNNSGCVCN